MGGTPGEWPGGGDRRRGGKAGEEGGDGTYYVQRSNGWDGHECRKMQERQECVKQERVRVVTRLNDKKALHSPFYMRPLWFEAEIGISNTTTYSLILDGAMDGCAPMLALPPQCR